MCCKLLAYSKKEKGPISAPRSTFWLWLARSSKDPRLNGFSGHVSGIPCDTHLFWEMLQNLWLCLVSCFAHLLPILDCWEMRCKKLASSVPNTCGFSWLWSRTDLIERPAFQHVQNFKLKQMLRPKCGWVSGPSARSTKKGLWNMFCFLSVPRGLRNSFFKSLKEQGQQSLKSIDISGNCARSCSLGFTRAALLDDALLHHGCWNLLQVTLICALTWTVRLLHLPCF